MGAERMDELHELKMVLSTESSTPVKGWSSNAYVARSFDRSRSQGIEVLSSPTHENTWKKVKGQVKICSCTKGSNIIWTFLVTCNLTQPQYRNLLFLPRSSHVLSVKGQQRTHCEMCIVLQCMETREKTNTQRQKTVLRRYCKHKTFFRFQRSPVAGSDNIHTKYLAHVIPQLN